MIFAEGTDMNLNYLQPKGICIFPKIMGYRTKVSFIIKQPNNIQLLHFRIFKM